MNSFRQTAPAPLTPIPFAVPSPTETALPNGLKIVLLPDNRLPLVSVRLAFLSGDADEPRDRNGATSALTAMLNEGTQTRSSKQLAEEIERLGASISASSGADHTLIGASALSLYRADVLRLLAEMILSPTFPENELALYRQNSIENIKFQRSQPSFLANEQMARILYGEHPYSIVSPSVADLENITREKLIELHRRIFVPNNAIMFVVGDFQIDELTAEIEDLFGEWQAGEVSRADHPPLPVREKITLTMVDRPGSAQSNIIIGNLAIERANPDYFPVLVMNQVLGAGASSRLFMNLREAKGYTYGAYSRLNTRRNAGDFESTAEVRTAVTGDALKEFFFELNLIRDQKVTDEELQDAKNFLAGVFPIRAETQEGLTNLIVSQKLYDLPADYLETYRDKINAVTVEEIARAAEKYVLPHLSAMVIVGDVGEILPQIAGYSDAVEIFDTEGNAKNMEDYTEQNANETADAGGDWELILNFQGQQLPISLSLEQNGETVSGTIESMLGTGEINDGKIAGNKLSAVAAIEFQGQKLDLNISGIVSGDSLNGTINTPVLPVPVEFAGTRKKDGVTVTQKKKAEKAEKTSRAIAAGFPPNLIFFLPRRSAFIRGQIIHQTLLEITYFQLE